MAKKRNHKVLLNFTSEEIQELKQKADSSGCPLAVFLRMLCLSHVRIIFRPIADHSE